MKKIGKLFIALGIIAVFASCIKVTDKIAELTKIEITSQADKVEFFAGEELDTAGLEVTAFYSDGTKKEVENWSATGFDSSVIGEQTITVTYTEDDVTKTTSYKVTVKALTLDKIEITAQAEKTEYYVGDVFDTTGLVVTATYNSGKTEDVTAKAEITGFDSTTVAASQTITVTYEDKTAQFTVNIIAVAVVKLKITAQPTITEYYIGDNFDKAGLEVTATYNSGKTEDVTAKAKFTGFDSRNATEKCTVTAAYGGKTATFTVKILAVEVTKNEITTEPAKKDYYIGERLDTTGLKVTATFSNGTTDDVTSKITISGFDSSAAVESQTITVTYGGKSATFTVKIIGVNEIKITKPATNTKFYQFQNVDTEGLEITVVYNDGKTKVVEPDKYTFECDSKNKETKTATIKYLDKTVSYPVKIVELSGIEIKTEPTKKEYYIGDSLDISGIKVLSNYADQTTKDVTANVKTSGFDSSAATESKTITVTYGGKSATFTVKINPVLLTGIVITTEPTKKEYYVGVTALDIKGMVVTATYNNGTTADVTKDVTTSGFDSSAATESKTITVTYGGKSATFTVKINPVLLTGIVITAEPTKKEYHIDDALDLTGMVVTANYNDGSFKALPSTEYTVTGFDSTSYVNDEEITVTYNEDDITKTATFKINVVFNWYETPKQLAAGTDGTYGTEGTYVYFGVWPQDVVATDEVATLGLETSTYKITRGYMEFVRGTDGNYYVKCAENAYISGYRYKKDGTAVGQDGITSRWFKVMPIKWRVADSAYDVDGDTGSSTAKLLVAENILTSNVPYYEEWLWNRKIDGKNVYANNNYMHSQIRAYLNGNTYTGYDKSTDSNIEESQWNNKGFLQTAFTSEAINKIITTKVDNSEDSTTDKDGNIQKATEYACDPTDDKIFLLSEYEVTKYSRSSEAYNAYDSYGKRNSRIRVATDFAKANHAVSYNAGSDKGDWGLRSPMYDHGYNVRYVNYDGNTDENSFCLVNRTNVGIVPALSISF